MVEIDRVLRDGTTEFALHIEGTHTYTANGITLTGHTADEIRDDYFPDGSERFFETGIHNKIELPGYGMIWTAVGRFVGHVGADGVFPSSSSRALHSSKTDPDSSRRSAPTLARDV